MIEYASGMSGCSREPFTSGLCWVSGWRPRGWYTISSIRQELPPVPDGPFAQWRISCDYGTRNPASFGLWGQKNGVWYRIREFYYDARAEGRQMTDGEYVQALTRLAGGRDIERVLVDPSAASFLEALRRAGWPARKADNRVLEGIRLPPRP